MVEKILGSITEPLTSLCVYDVCTPGVDDVVAVIGAAGWASVNRFSVVGIPVAGGCSWVLVNGGGDQSVVFLMTDLSSISLMSFLLFLALLETSFPWALK